MLLFFVYTLIIIIVVDLGMFGFVDADAEFLTQGDADGIYGVLMGWRWVFYRRFPSTRPFI